MWNLPTAEQLATIPKLSETGHLPLMDKVIQFHFFIGGCDWFISEFDGKDTFFGFAILHGDLERAEWGHVSLYDLKSIKINGYLEIDCDLHWDPKPAREVELICRAQGWPINKGECSWLTLPN